MKTLEQKAKAYDEAIERAKELQETCDSQAVVGWCEYLLPELKKTESEGERIRKEITELVMQPTWKTEKEFHRRKELVAWLEKQGKHKQISTDDFDVVPGLYKCVHRMFDGTCDSKLLFEVGEVYKCLTKHDRAEFEISYGHSVYLEDPIVRKHFIPFEKQGEQKSTIQPKFKDGDVLVNGSNIFIFHFINDTRLMGYCHINTDNGRFYDDIGKNECFCLIDAVVNPATKEQRDLLFTKMKEAGYVWDAERKELKKIEMQNPVIQPKFKVGDWVVDEDDNSIHQIECVLENVTSGNFSYDLVGGGYFPSTKKNYHLWSIQDAKDGDVLADEYGIYIFNSCDSLDDKLFICKCAYEYSKKAFEIGGMLCKKTDVYPASREQRDHLFQKMHEDGYTFDFEKKELKKLKFRVGDEVITENEESLTITKIDKEGYWSNDLFICDFDSECVWDLVEKKPTEWSLPYGKNETAEKLIALAEILEMDGDCLFNGVSGNSYGKFLRVLAKELTEVKPAWSEEDEIKIKSIITFLKSPSLCDMDGNKGIIDANIKYLKSIKDRMQPKQEWKQENREELTEFENAMMHIGGSFFGENAGLDPNDTDTIKEQAELLLELAPKTEWSKEDEHRVKDIIYFLDTAKKHYASTVELDACIDWLKSLKDKATPQPIVEWSEEDNSIVESILYWLKSILNVSCYPRYEHWVESLKARVQLKPAWKPSEEQMKVLDEVLTYAANHESPYWHDYILGTLNNLIRQLKKLKA